MDFKSEIVRKNTIKVTQRCASVIILDYELEEYLESLIQNGQPACPVGDIQWYMANHVIGDRVIVIT